MKIAKQRRGVSWRRRGLAQTIFFDIDNKRSISYNGRHYTLFLPQDDPVPFFQEDVHVFQFGIGNTHARSSWIVPYDFNAHVLRQQKRAALSTRACFADAVK